MDRLNGDKIRILEGKTAEELMEEVEQIIEAIRNGNMDGELYEF